MVNQHLTCDRCGLALHTGDPVWRVHIALTAEVVQGLKEYEGMSKTEMNGRLKALLARIEMMPKEMLENQVYQEFSFLVCSRCRGILAANPLQQPLDSAQ
ncbi:MAG: hypothetical protein WBM02_03990 [bacterium]